MNSEPTPKQPQSTPKSERTADNRVPITQIFYREAMDLQNGYANQSSTVCVESTINGRGYFLGYWVPAERVIDLDYYPRKGADPVRSKVPIEFIKRFTY